MTHTRDDKVGAIDAAGRWAVPPRYQELDTFNSGYAWALPLTPTAATRPCYSTRWAARRPLPDAVRRNGEYLDGGLITYYALDDDHERVWGLWDIRKNAPALKPSLAAIEKCEGDWARAQSGDRWGVIGRDGKWRIKPDYEGAYRLDYLGQGYMLTEEAKPAGQSDAYDSFYRLHHLPSGKASPLLRGKPQALEGGARWACWPTAAPCCSTRAAVRSACSRASREPAPVRRLDLAQLRRPQGRHRRARQYEDRRRERRIQSFFVQPDGLARVNTPQGYRLMDQNGAIVQARLGDAMPLASMQRLVVEDRDGSRSVMVDMQGREIARFNKTYSVDASTASEGVVVYEGDNGRHGFVNAEGKRVVGPYFNKLGRCAISARREQRSGKLYGYIDLTGRYAIAPAFAWADDFREGRALARRGDQLMYIDPRGQAAASFSLVCGAVVIRDAQQRVTWPASRSPAPTPPACNTRRPPKPPKPDSHDLTPDSPHPPGLRRRRAGPALAAQAQQYWHASCAYDAPSRAGGFYDGERRRQRLHPFHFRRPRRRAAAFRPALDQARADRHLLRGRLGLPGRPGPPRGQADLRPGRRFPSRAGRRAVARQVGLSTPAAAWPPSRRASTKFPISSRPGWRSSRWTASARSSTARASRPATRSTRPWTTRSCRTACPRG